MSELSIALNRFGLGARPDEAPPAAPRRWLVEQLARFEVRPAVLAAVPSREEAGRRLRDYREARRDLRRELRERAPAAGEMAGGEEMAAQAMAPAPMKPAGAQRRVKIDRNDPIRVMAREHSVWQRDAHVAGVGARATMALASAAPFVERLVHFWANHFAVSAKKIDVLGTAPWLEFEAIRPHVLGRFADMLLAAERHPAMLLYLDQARSIGPGSRVGAAAAERGRKAGLNENLAREALELHTLGVGGGYTQGDVGEFARALTGWTVSGVAVGRAEDLTRDRPAGEFAFLEPLHEPGERTILGKRYPAGGEEQAGAVLRDLAVHPSTARHLSTKLARHFAGDVPPPALVARLERAFLASGGDLPAVYRALVEAPECWVAQPVKFKTPWEWTLSSLRALGRREIDGPAVVQLAQQLGQPVWVPGQPSGWDDVAASWAGPDAIMRRVEAAERLASQAPAEVDARALAPRLYPASVSPATAEALRRADSPGQALAMLLVAPEAMRR